MKKQGVGKIKSVKFNFIMNSILSASMIIFPLISYPYVSRVIQPSGTGAVSFVNSVVTYFSMFAQLGIPTYGIRACAQVRDNKEELTRTVQEIMLINLMTCVIVYIVFGIAINVVPQFRAEKTLFLIMGSMILFNAIGVEWLYKGLEQYSYITVRSIIFKGIALVAMFLLIRDKQDYAIYGAITILASVGSNLLNFLNLRRYVSLKLAGKLDLRRHMKPISIFFAMSVATTIYTNMDNVMIGFIKGTTENGYYDAAIRIKNILVSFVTSLGTVLMPRVSYYIENGEEENFQQITKKALHFVVLISIPLCVYFIIFARLTILLIAGDLYENSILPMQLIMPTLVLIGLSNIIGLQMLVPLGREKQVLYSEVVGAVVNLIINSCLIPSIGAAGAAIGTVAAELAVLAFQIFVLRAYIKSYIQEIQCIPLAIALVISVGVSFWIRSMEMGAFLMLLISSFLFFGIYFLTLLLTREKLVWELTREIWGNFKARFVP